MTHTKIGWKIELHSTPPADRRLSVCLTSEESAAVTEGILKHQKTIERPKETIFVAEIPGASLYGPNALVLTAAGRVISESALGSTQILDESGLPFALFPRRAKKMPGRYALIMSPWSSFAYYHWMMEALPRISLLEPSPAFADAKLIVPPRLLPYHSESLAAAGIPPERMTNYDGGPWQVDALIYPQVLGLNGSATPRAVDWLRTMFLERRGAAPRRGKRIFLSRRDSRRNITNEAEVLRALEPFGVESVCLSHLSIREQASLFSEAELVIGPHGAAFTNLVFAPEGCQVIELFGRNYINGCFWALAHVRNQQHASLVCPATTLDFQVPIDRLKALLSRLEISPLRKGHS